MPNITEMIGKSIGQFFSSEEIEVLNIKEVGTNTSTCRRGTSISYDYKEVAFNHSNITETRTVVVIDNNQLGQGVFTLPGVSNDPDLLDYGAKNIIDGLCFEKCDTRILGFKCIFQRGQKS